MKSVLLTSALALTALMLPVAAHAQEATADAAGYRIFDSVTLTGTAAVTSDYVFRGVTQNDESPAFQASIDLAHDSGFFGGIWGSQVDFFDADVEIDAYVGYGLESGPWSGSINYTYYMYPGADDSLDYDYGEFIADAGYDFTHFSLGAQFAWSPEFFGHSGHAEYIQANAEVPLPYDFTLHGAVGKQFIEDNVTYGTPDYIDWNVGVGYSWNRFDFDVSYTDTNLTKAECADGCEGRVLGTVTFNF